MSRARVAITRAAARDIEDITAYYALDNPQAATRFKAALLQILQQLKQFPELGRKANEFSIPLRTIPVCGRFRR